MVSHSAKMVDSAPPMYLRRRLHHRHRETPSPARPRFQRWARASHSLQYRTGQTSKGVQGLLWVVWESLVGVESQGTECLGEGWGWVGVRSGPVPHFGGRNEIVGLGLRRRLYHYHHHETPAPARPRFQQWARRTSHSLQYRRCWRHRQQRIPFPAWDG